MNKKKLSRLLEPNLKLYFACMFVFAAATATVSLALGLVEIACTVGLYAYFTKRNQSRRQNILQYIDNVTGSVDTASKSTLINSPLPIMVFRPDTGEVIWSNENFLQLAGVREHLFEMKVEDAVPDFPVQWLLEGKQECPDRVVMNSRRFRVYGSLVRAKGRGAEQNLVATTYWVDTTEADDLRERYTATRPVLAILMVDNYEDLMKACADTQRSAVLAQIDEKLNNWAACADGLLLKTERDHYLFIFEECHYDHFVEEKFSILDAIREIKVGDVCPTLSIGIGKDADAMAELYRNARLSLEMALSRGGDQAVVRGKVDFQFYGGRSKSTEKRTKVKSRVMASALNELMADASEIYIMGHSFADMDAVGAEAGLYCIARKHGKHAQIVIDLERNAAGAVLCQAPGPAGVRGGLHHRGGGVFADAARRPGDRGGHQPPRHGGASPAAGVQQPGGGDRPPPPGGQLHRKRRLQLPRALRLLRQRAGDGAAAVPGGARRPAAGGGGGPAGRHRAGHEALHPAHRRPDL